MGIYIRVSPSMSGNFHPYAIVGFNRSRFKASFENQSLSGSDADLSFGLGANISIESNLAINLEFINIYDHEDIEVRGLSLGVHFDM